MNPIVAVDPGTMQSAVIYYRDGMVLDKAILPNEQLLAMLGLDLPRGFDLAIEMIASYGMPVGKEVFETCVWIGRFIEANEGNATLIYRKDVKLHMCGSPRAKDANIRQAVMDRLGGMKGVGVKKNPGPLYGIKSHMWAALAVAVTYDDVRKCEEAD